jgi:hypothetical protein
MSSIIVTFKENTPISVIDDAADKIKQSGGTIGHRYDGALLGFSAKVPDNHISTLL